MPCPLASRRDVVEKLRGSGTGCVCGRDVLRKRTPPPKPTHPTTPTPLKHTPHPTGTRDAAFDGRRRPTSRTDARVIPKRARPSVLSPTQARSAHLLCCSAASS
jgi:hypothetical protein